MFCSECETFQSLHHAMDLQEQENPRISESCLLYFRITEQQQILITENRFYYSIFKNILH